MKPRVEINDFIEEQLALWPEAHKRYLDLAKVERRKFRIGDFEGFFQFNPARILSTGAKVDKDSLKNRKCFLCGENRPSFQLKLDIVPGWEFLLNPFPIFPVHFTIAAQDHIPQKKFPPESILFADLYPELAIFFNGSRSGASAPDHAHLQAVLKQELPLIALVERYHPSSEPGIVCSSQFGVFLPFIFYSAVIPASKEGEMILARMSALTGKDPETQTLDAGLRNVVLWKDPAGLLRMIVIPRKAHRPHCYFAEGEEKMMVSPGTIDMCGVVVLPRREDFDSIDSEAMKVIYSQVAFT